jgi:hypothetical protein
MVGLQHTGGGGGTMTNEDGVVYSVYDGSPTSAAAGGGNGGPSPAHHAHSAQRKGGIQRSGRKVSVYNGFGPDSEETGV